MIGNLRNMAVDMGSEVEAQNRQLDRINLKVGILPNPISTSGFQIRIRIGSAFFKSLVPDPHFSSLWIRIRILIGIHSLNNFFYVKNANFLEKTSNGSGSANISNPGWFRICKYFKPRIRIRIRKYFKPWIRICIRMK